MNIIEVFKSNDYDASIVVSDLNNLSDVINDAVLYCNSLLSERPEIMIYGKICHQHRNIGFFSNDVPFYKYSGKSVNSIPLNNSLLYLLNFINDNFDTNFNAILVNKYCDGNDYIGAHTDNEKDINTDNGVISISYGASRKFRIRNKQTKKIVFDIDTLHNYLLCMKGNDFQNKFTHEIPLQKKLKNHDIHLLLGNILFNYYF